MPHVVVLKTPGERTFLLTTLSHAQDLSSHHRDANIDTAIAFHCYKVLCYWPQSRLRKRRDVTSGSGSESGRPETGRSFNIRQQNERNTGKLLGGCHCILRHQRADSGHAALPTWLWLSSLDKPLVVRSSIRITWLFRSPLTEKSSIILFIISVSYLFVQCSYSSPLYAAIWPSSN